MAFLLDTFEDDGVRSDGIFNCRPIRGAGGYSAHAEGRADDVGFPLINGKANPAGGRLVELIRPQAAALGVCCMIWNRRIWSQKSPDKDGRPYPGADPHTGHVHIELTRRAAAVLNLTTLRFHLQTDSGTAPAPTPNAGANKKPYGRIQWEPFDRAADPGRRRLERGSRGHDVAYVQRMIGARRCGRDDGWYGDRTVQAVRWYQDMRGVKITGVVDKGTWAHLSA